jgi:hypothetical protein
MMLIAVLYPKMDGIVRFFDRVNRLVGRLYIYVVLQESIANGNPSLVKLIMKYRNYQRNVQRIRGIPELLRKLKEVKTIAFKLYPEILLYF